VRRQGDRFHFSVRNTPYKLYFEEAPLVLLDGVPVADINKIMALDPLKLKKLEVVARRYFVGSRAVNGIVSYTSYKGDLAGVELGKQALALEQAGLLATREFYTPVYDTEQQRSSRLPDFRHVLYWMPNVKTDTSGEATLTFYTSDLKGQYQVQVQGITTEGVPVHAATTFTVTE
jgi:hypothetical protein